MDYIKEVARIASSPDYIKKLNEIAKPKKTTPKKPKVSGQQAFRNIDNPLPQPKKLKPNVIQPTANKLSKPISPKINDAVDYAQRVTEYKGYFGGSGAATGASGVGNMLFEKKLAAGEIDANDPALTDAWRQVYGTGTNAFGKSFLNSASLGATDALASLDAKNKANKFGDKYAQLQQNVNAVSKEEDDKNKVASTLGTVAGAILPFSEGASVATAGARKIVDSAGRFIPTLGKLGNTAVREGASRFIGNALTGAGVAGLQSAIAGNDTKQMLTDSVTGLSLGGVLPEIGTSAIKGIGKGVKKLLPAKAVTATADAVTDTVKPQMRLKRKINSIPAVVDKVDDVMPTKTTAQAEEIFTDYSPERMVADNEKVYYRGTNGSDTRKISTGNSTWDNNLFVSKDKKLAMAYGNNIEVITPKQDAKILTEGTPEFNKLYIRQRKNENLLDWGTRVITKAKEQGYDIVEFSRQGDVGTVVLNENSVLRNRQIAAKADDVMTVKPDTNIGAMESQFANEQAVSKVKSNTIKNTPFLTDEVKAKLPDEQFMYDVIPEKQSMATAQQRLETDYMGEVDDLITDNRKMTGEDMDTAMIAATSMADSGDFNTAVKLIKNVQKNGTSAGQTVQSLAKWSRGTPIGKVLEAEQITDAAVREATETKPLFGKITGKKPSKNALGEKIEKEAKGAVTEIKKDAEEVIEDITQHIDDASTGKKTRTKKATTGKSKDGKPVPKGMKSREKDNIPVEDWATETGNLLSKNLENRTALTVKQKPTMQIILNDLVKLAEEHALPKRPKATARTAVDRLRDYFGNKAFYTKAWKQAQENMRTKYAKNPEMLDAFDEWINSTISYNADPMATDKTMMDAIMKTVSETDETVKSIMSKASLGDEAGITNKLYEHLKQAIDVDSADAKSLQGAVERFVKDKIAGDDATGRVGKMVKGALSDIKVKLSELVSKNKATKDNVRQEITQLLIAKHGISAEAAETAANKISEQFDTMLKASAKTRLEAIVKTGKNGTIRRTMMQKVQELINLGAYDDESLRKLVLQKEGLPVLDSDDAKKIYDLMTEAAEQTDDYARRMYEDKAAQIVRNKLPVSLRNKVLGIRRMAMLLNPKTLLMRNPGGNAVFDAIDYVKDVPGVAIDKATSKFTGVRTTSINPLQDMAATAKGMKKGTVELAKDIWNRTDTSVTKHEMMPRTFKNKPLNFLDQTLNKLLQAGDRPFYEGAYQKRLVELKRLGNDITNENVIAQAKEYALDKVFQNSSLLSKKARQLKDALGVVGDISLPFTQTPANILDKMVDYTPAGLVKAGYYARKMATGGAEKLAWNQKKFVDSAARSLTGSGLIYLGYALAKNGVVTGGSNSNAKVREADKRAGKQSYAFVVDGNSYTYDWASPVGGLIAAGADAYIAGKKKGDVINLASVTAAAKGFGNSIFKQSYLDGLSDLFAYGNPAEGLTQSVADLPSSFIPTAFKQTAQSIDPYQRDTYDESEFKTGINKIKAKIPGLSMTLQPKIGPDGKPVENYQGRGTKAIESTLSPGFYAENAQTAAEKEMYRVYQETKKTTVLPGLGDVGSSKTVTINGNDIQLSPTEWTQYQKDYYSLLNKRVTKTIMEPMYKKLSDADKAKHLTSVQNDVGDTVLENFAKAKGIKIEDEKTVKDTSTKSRNALRDKALRIN